MALAVALPLGSVSWAADTLYIGDAGLADIKKFDADTNGYLGSITGTNCFSPDGPFGGDATGYWNAQTSGPCQAFGMVIVGSQDLYVSNGNNGVYLYDTRLINVSGDVMRFNAVTGQALPKLVSPTAPSGDVNFNAPYSPRGTLFYQGKIYVADMAELDHKVGVPKYFPEDGTMKYIPADCDSYYAGSCEPGSIKVYDALTGRLVQKLLPGKKDAFPVELFHPRGIVIKDGLLYAAVRKLPNDPDFQLGGWVLRFDLATGKFKDVLIESEGGCVNPTATGCDPTDQLNRPEGIVFGPDGKIYVASFRKDGSDTDKVMIFNPDGTYADRIDLAAPTNTGAKRAYAQALLFGPGGKLMVPITAGSDLGGEVRQYDVTDPSYPYVVIIPSYAAGGPLGAGWNLTYGRTDPATLEYHQ